MEETTKKKTLTKEELMQTNTTLVNEYKKLYDAFERLKLDNLFSRLNYLHKVLEHYELYPQKFTEKVVEEIMSIMYSEEKTEETSLEEKE